MDTVAELPTTSVTTTFLIDLSNPIIIDDGALVARGIQVDPTNGISMMPPVTFSFNHLYCTLCRYDLQKLIGQEPSPLILGITPLQGSVLVRDAGTKIAYMTMKCPCCQKLVSSLINSDLYRILQEFKMLPQKLVA